MVRVGLTKCFKGFDGFRTIETGAKACFGNDEMALLTFSKTLSQTVALDKHIVCFCSTILI